MEVDEKRNAAREPASARPAVDRMAQDQRRHAVFQMRSRLARGVIFGAPLLGVLGLAFMALAVILWIEAFQLSLASSLAVFCGSFAALYALSRVWASRLQSQDRLQSDEFTDADISAFEREREQRDQRLASYWNKTGKYSLIGGGGVLMGLMLYSPTAPFVSLFFFTAAGVLWIGLVVFVCIRAIQNYRIRHKPKGR